MMIVDSHCHVSPCWYEPVESLLFQMDRNNVARAVLIQMNGQANNDYQFDVMRRFPGRFASVVWIQADQPGASETLKYLATRGISGVRLAATTRSPGTDGLAIWRTAAELGLAVSCSGSSNDFGSREFAQLVQALPELTIVLEHLGGHGHAGTKAPGDRWHVLELARFANVYIKVHGLGEFCHRCLPVSEPFSFETPVPPLLDMAYQAFGPRRIMWGSDYPPVGAREGYRNALRLPLEQFGSKNEEERALIFGQVALTVFRAPG